MVNINQHLDELIRNFSVDQGIDESTTAKFVIEALQNEIVYLANKVSLTNGNMPLPFSQKYVIKETGDCWQINFGSEEGIFKKSKGMKYITLLIQHPNDEITLSNMIQMAGEQELNGKKVAYSELNSDLSIAPYSGYCNDPIMDKEYLTDIKNQLESLNPDILEEQEEISEIKKFLLDAYAPGGKVRHFRDQSLEKERKRIGNAVRRTIKNMTNNCPELSMHLSNSVHLGNILKYTPEKPIPWILK